VLKEVTNVVSVDAGSFCSSLVVIMNIIMAPSNKLMDVLAGLTDDLVNGSLTNQSF